MKEVPIEFTYPRAPLAHSAVMNAVELGERVASAMFREDDGWGFGANTAHLFDVPGLGIISSTRRQPGDRKPYENPPTSRPVKRPMERQFDIRKLGMRDTTDHEE